MKMTIEDYIQKQRDITYLKLTREVQEVINNFLLYYLLNIFLIFFFLFISKYLNTEDFDGKKQKEVSVLEQTIAYKKEQYAKLYTNRNKKLKSIRDQSVKLANDNENLDDELKDKNVVLYDRKHIETEMSKSLKLYKLI